MKFISWLLAVLVFFTSCKTGSSGFGKKSFHEQYGKKLSAAGLDESALGRRWFSASQEALNKPLQVNLPFRQIGYFAADKPEAIGLSFQAKRGQKLLFQVKINPASGFIVYNEIWRINAGERSLEFAADTTAGEFQFEVDESGTYLFRMQPELLQSGEYNLSISIGPSLNFPVAGTTKIGSFWGAPRDGGARSHEGIDIFAPKRTPVLATSNGTVTRVTENNIGGKVIFLRPEDKDFSVYYAHLDEQLVTAGTKVKAGDTLGLVGNTGNARTTPPHLHFGIYAAGGAIDPLVFVDPVLKKPGSVAGNAQDLQQHYRIIKDIKISNGLILPKNSIVRTLAKSTESYWVEISANSKVKIEHSNLQIAKSPLITRPVTDTVYVFERPDPSSPRKGFISSGKLSVLGTEGAFDYVKAGDLEGWVQRKTK